MLKLLRWEWEIRLKKALLVWTPVVIVLYIISRGVEKYIWEPLRLYLYKGEETAYHQALNLLIEEKGVLYYFINTTTGRFAVLGMIAGIASWVCVIVLGRIVASIIWKEQEIRGSYLLLTVPEPASKILAAKLLATLPLLAIMAVVVSLFILPIFYWWVLLLILSTVIMLVVFAGVVGKTVLHKVWLIVIAALVIGGILIFAGPSFFYEGWIEWLGVFPEVVLLPNLVIFLLIAVSTALFFASAYLLENKVDI